MKPFIISVAVSALACIGVVAVSQVRPVRAGDRLSAALPGKRGPDGALLQARALMRAYQSAGKKWSQVDRSLNETPRPKTGRGRQPTKQQCLHALRTQRNLQGQNSVWVRQYVNQNLSYEGGDLVKADPRGLWIVGYESGEIKQIPVSQVRYFYRKTSVPGGEEWSYVFPGMREYPIADPKPGTRRQFPEIEP